MFVCLLIIDDDDDDDDDDNNDIYIYIYITSLLYVQRYIGLSLIMLGYG